MYSPSSHHSFLEGHRGCQFPKMYFLHPQKSSIHEDSEVVSVLFIQGSYHLVFSFLNSFLTKFFLEFLQHLEWVQINYREETKYPSNTTNSIYIPDLH